MVSSVRLQTLIAHKKTQASLGFPSEAFSLVQHYLVAVCYFMKLLNHNAVKFIEKLNIQMKSKILMFIVSLLIAVLVFNFYGYKILGIEKFVEKRKSCAEYSNGGGEMTTTYGILEFSKDDVLYYTEDSNHRNNGYKKSFKYSKKDNYIYIKRSTEDYMLVDFDTMRIVGDTLRGCCGTAFIKQ